MAITPFRQARKIFVVSLLAISGAAVAGCTTGSQQVATSKSGKGSKEYFAESEYGVKASPRVSSLKSNLPRGGGRDHVGKPYKIRGKWYHPKDDPNYRSTGLASWYGDAFHGRLTANGEVYDMTHLTAAHPTLPLPSYARVTNVDNGSSVVVRINDRGPFHGKRVIDLSRRAAEMLDYTQAGVAKVDVEYMGRAPLHGRDDAFLMASYRPGGRAPDPSDGFPTGVMVAMAGSTPNSASGTRPAFPGTLRDVKAGSASSAASAAATNAFPAASQPTGTVLESDPVLPAYGPIAPERPGIGLAAAPRSARLELSYADRRIDAASEALSNFAADMDEGDILAYWARNGSAESPDAAEFIAVGTFASLAEAEAIAGAMRGAGRAVIETDRTDGSFVVNLHPDGRSSVDDMLRLAWQLGAADAMTVRR